MKRIVPIWVMSSVLLVAGGALCQSERAPEGLLQGDGSNSLEARQDARTWKSLPDAPSTVQSPKQAEKFHLFADEGRLPLAFGGVGINAGVMREAEPRHLARIAAQLCGIL